MNTFTFNERSNTIENKWHPACDPVYSNYFISFLKSIHHKQIVESREYSNMMSINRRRKDSSSQVICEGNTSKKMKMFSDKLTPLLTTQYERGICDIEKENSPPRLPTNRRIARDRLAARKAKCPNVVRRRIKLREAEKLKRYGRFFGEDVPQNLNTSVMEKNKCLCFKEEEEVDDGEMGECLHTTVRDNNKQYNLQGSKNQITSLNNEQFQALRCSDSDVGHYPHLLPTILESDEDEEPFYWNKVKSQDKICFNQRNEIMNQQMINDDDDDDGYVLMFPQHVVEHVYECVDHMDTSYC